MNSISYSAPGKVILSGEHAVVYGKPAITCAIDRRLKITVTPAKKTVYADAVLPVLERTVHEFLKLKNIAETDTGYRYEITSDIPQGRGLGSSAAYCAVISASLLELFAGKTLPIEDINMCAYRMEKYFHKNSSGVDTSTSVMGGLIYYRKEFEFLKTISSLTVKIPKTISDSLILIDTGRPEETTGEMVAKVGTLYNAKPELMESLLGRTEKATKRLVVSLMKEDMKLFRASMSENESLLEEMGVVSDSTKALMHGLKEFGCGKITGGGGYEKASGYILFSVDDKYKLERLLKSKGIPCAQFVPSYVGLKKEL